MTEAILLDENCTTLLLGATSATSGAATHGLHHHEPSNHHANENKHDEGADDDSHDSTNIGVIIFIQVVVDAFDESSSRRPR